MREREKKRERERLSPSPSPLPPSPSPSPSRDQIASSSSAWRDEPDKLVDHHICSTFHTVIGVRLVLGNYLDILCIYLLTFNIWPLWRLIVSSFISWMPR